MDDSDSEGVVPEIEGCSYEYFYKYHLERNLPCIIKGVGRNWKATKLWANDNKPNFKYLRSEYAESVVTVYNCKEKYFNSHPTSEMKFEDYLNYWQKYSKAEDKSGMELLYLKDWHMKNENKNDDFYEVPLYFSSDWLNEYLVAVGKDDYRFVYMGPLGSWTPLHKDVMNTFSWSVNICGYKKWLLLHPGEEKKLMDKSGKLPLSVDNLPEDIRHCYIIQQPGDAIFVPSGWYHQVWNLKDTISINHNWINATSISRMENSLGIGLQDVQKEISHLSKENDFQAQCEAILRCDVGMNHEDFFEFIRFITLRRLRKYNTQQQETELENQMLKRDIEACQESLMQIFNHLNETQMDEAMNMCLQMSTIIFNKTR